MMLISFIAFLLLWKTQKNKNEDKKQIPEGNELLDINKERIPVENNEKFDLKTIIYLLIILWTSVLLIGCIPSINSFSLNPYGASTFHYVIILCKFYSKIFFKKFFFYSLKRSMLLSTCFYVC